MLVAMVLRAGLCSEQSPDLLCSLGRDEAAARAKTSSSSGLHASKARQVMISHKQMGREHARDRRLRIGRYLM